MSSYIGLLGLGVFRWLKSIRKTTATRSTDAVSPQAHLSTHAPAELALPAPKPEHEELASLSLGTPSDAALDRLARRARWEEEDAAKIKPGGGRAEVRKAAPVGTPQPWRYDSPIVSTILEQQPLEAERLSGWHIPQPERLPLPTFAPSVMAMGIVIFAMGLASSFYVCVVGSVVFAVAAWRWTGVLQGE